MFNKKLLSAKSAGNFLALCVLCFLFFFLSSVYCVQAQPFSLDTTFNPTFDFNNPDPGNVGEILDFYEEANGSLMVAGYFFDQNTFPYTAAVRILQNGNIDPSWNPPTSMGDCNSVTKHDSDYIFRAAISYLVKKDFYGVDDMSWYNNVNNVNHCGKTAPYVFQDGSVLVGRWSCGADITPESRKWIIKFLPDGIVDTSFHHNSNLPATRITRYDTTRLLLYGMTLYDSVPVNWLCRIDTLGNLDTTFHSIITWGGVYDMSVQSDGKIVCVGDFTIQNYPDSLSVIRLKSNGSLDSSFNNFNSIIYHPGLGNAVTVCPTSDGGYLIGGEFTSYQGYFRGNIAKTDANGFLDTTYFTGQGVNGTLPSYPSPVIGKIRKSIVADKYYVMGSFTHFNSDSVEPIIRLNGLSYTGVEENEKGNNELKVFPNPASNQLIIDNGQLKIELVEIYDLLGEKVFRLERAVHSQQQIIIDVSAIPIGIYFIQLRSNSQTSTQKLIVSR